MLINKLSKSDGDSEEGFRGTLKTRMWIFGVFALVGAAVIASAIIATSGAPLSGDHRSDYESGFAIGLGSAFIAAGLVRFMQTRAALHNPDRFRKAYTEHVDERNRFIIMKTYQTAAAVYICLIALASIVAVFLNPVVANTLSVCLGSFALIVFIVQRMVMRKY